MNELLEQFKKEQTKRLTDIDALIEWLREIESKQNETTTRKGDHKKEK